MIHSASEPVIHPRKLAAIDILLLGSRFVIAEFAGAVLLCPVLGTFVLWRSQSLWQLLLGLYIILLGINYVPMLLYAVAIAKSHTAQQEMGNELQDQRRAMAKYRRQSVSLLIPLLVPVIALLRERRRKARFDNVAAD